MLALSNSSGVIIVILGAVTLLLSVATLVLRGRTKREPGQPDIPATMRPGPSDAALETPLLHKLQGWSVILVAFFAIWIPITWLREPSENLAQERLTQAIRSAAVVEAVLQSTIEYAAERKMFGQTLANFQNTQFKLAEIKTEVTAGRVFVDKCIELFLQGKLDGTDAAMVKLWMANLHCRVVDDCLQMFGANGYLRDWGIEQRLRDVNALLFTGGTVNIMKLILVRELLGKDFAGLHG